MVGDAQAIGLTETSFASRGEVLAPRSTVAEMGEGTLGSPALPLSVDSACRETTSQRGTFQRCRPVHA